LQFQDVVEIIQVEVLILRCRVLLILN
jgi:hypothetical protein